MTSAHANQAIESPSPATSNPSDLPRRSADAVFLAICVGIAGMLAVAASTMPRFAAWAFAVVYLAGMVAATGLSGLGYAMRLRRGAAGMVFRRGVELGRQHLGPRWVFYTLIGFLVGVSTWPLQIVKGVYLSRIVRTKIAPELQFAFGEPLVPVWLGPTMLTFIGLSLFELCTRHSHVPVVVAAETSLVAATVLTLLLYSLPSPTAEENSGAMDSFLSSVGGPKTNFIILLLSTLGSASLSHMIIWRWDGRGGGDIVASGWAILRSADLRAVAGLHHLTFDDLANATLWRQEVASFADVSLAGWIAALLGLLFYLGFIRRAVSAITVRREARHHVRIGVAYAALGRAGEALAELDAAERHQSAALNRTELIACGVLLRDKSFRDLTKRATKLCAMIHEPYSREEEAVLATLGTWDLPLDGATLAAYFEVATDFADGDLPLLLTLQFLDLAPDKPAFERDLCNNEVLSHRPLWRALTDSTDLRHDLTTFAPETLSARLMLPNLLLGVLEGESRGPPDVATLTRIDNHIASFVVDRDFARHWAVVIGLATLEGLRTGLSARNAPPQPNLDSLLAALTVRHQQSYLFGTTARNLAAFAARENAANAARMRRVLAGAT